MRAMTDNGGDLQLAELLEIYGEHWQIQADHDTGAWTAVQRPTPTALHILVGRDLDDLAGKLAKDVIR